VDPHDKFRPFLRGGNADLNMTAAMSFTWAASASARVVVVARSIVSMVSGFSETCLIRSSMMFLQ
jgi:hypothetical protein